MPPSASVGVTQVPTSACYAAWVSAGEARQASSGPCPSRHLHTASNCVHAAYRAGDRIVGTTGGRGVVSSSAELRIGDFYESSGNSVPLEVWTFFTQDDLVEVTEPLDPNMWAVVPGHEDEPVHQYLLRTSCAEARRRANARGIDLDLCRKLYQRFRPTARWDDGSGEHGDFVVWEPSFEEFLEVLRRPSSRIPGHQWQHVRDQYCDEKPPRWWDAWWELLGEPEYEDAAFLLYLRCVVEVVADEAPVVLDITDLVSGGYIDEASLPHLCEDALDSLRTQIELDYLIFGYALRDDPQLDEKLRLRIEGATEDQLRDGLLIPLLARLGFERIRANHFHGPGEQGKDVLPFSHATPLGTVEYYALQAKGVPIHGTAARPGNAAEITSQAAAALADSFVDDLDNERKRLDKFVVVTNKHITADARRTLDGYREQNRRVVLVDLDALVGLVKNADLVQYVLFSDW
jgi:hypothetical protein